VKVLRRHCGFTTNSSAASEWVSGPIGPTTPPGWKPAAPGLLGGAATTAPSVAPTAPVPGVASAIESAETGARPSPLLDNLAVLGGLLLAVLGVLAIERLIRRRLRRRSQDDV
jgi:hypothetical protein